MKTLQSFLKLGALALLVCVWMVNNGLQGYIAFACGHGHMHVAAAQHHAHHCHAEDSHHHHHSHDHAQNIHADDIAFDATQALLSNASHAYVVSLAQPAFIDWQQQLLFSYSNDSSRLLPQRAPPTYNQTLHIIQTTELLI